MDVEAEEEGRKNDNAERVENPRMLQDPHKFCLKQEKNYIRHKKIHMAVSLFSLCLDDMIFFCLLLPAIIMASFARLSYGILYNNGKVLWV